MEMEESSTPTETLTVQREDKEMSQRLQKSQETRGRPRRQRRAPDYYGVGPKVQNVGSESTSDEESPQEVRDEEDTQEYRVKNVLAKRRDPLGQREYRVQFMGYSPREAMWLNGSLFNEKALKEGRVASEVTCRKR